MLRFRTFFSVPLFAALAFLPVPSRAALISRYDLESLCYMSTDVVEATLDGYKSNPAAASGTATVTASLIGRYSPGAQVAISGLDLYQPAHPGQRCLLFIARRQFLFDSQQPKAIAPCVVDLLFIDKYNRVHRYFQWSNPGGLLAEGYPVPGSNDFVLNAYALDQKCPTLAAERSDITAKWAKAGQLRSLLGRKPRREDISALQAVAHRRRQPRATGQLGMTELQDVTSEVAQERLAELHAQAD